MGKTIKQSTREQIESLGFEISRRGKNYFAFGKMSGGLLFDATNHIGLLNEIEAYFKGLMQVDDARRQG